MNWVVDGVPAGISMKEIRDKSIQRMKRRENVE